jgi:hypothetical protein
VTTLAPTAAIQARQTIASIARLTQHKAGGKKIGQVLLLVPAKLPAILVITAILFRKYV